MSCFKQNGYEKVIPPLIEFEENYTLFLDTTNKQNIFRVIDPISNKPMFIRNDITPQIARIAANKLNMKIACEIFADRNYEDDGNLVSRSKDHALITDPNVAKKHVLSMVKNQALNCFSGKQIPCEIDSVCIHGDNMNSINTAISIKNNLVNAITETPRTRKNFSSASIEVL